MTVDVTVTWHWVDSLGVSHFCNHEETAARLAAEARSLLFKRIYRADYPATLVSETIHQNPFWNEAQS